MFEREGALTSVNDKLRKEIDTLKNINNKGRKLLKIGVAGASLFGVERLAHGQTPEAAVAGAISMLGLLILVKDPLAWKIDYKEAAIENSEEPHLAKA